MALSSTTLSARFAPPTAASITLSAAVGLLLVALAAPAQAQERVHLDDLADWRLRDARLQTIAALNPFLFDLDLGVSAARVPQAMLGESNVTEGQVAMTLGYVRNLRDELILDADLRSSITRSEVGPDDRQAFPLTEGRLRARGKLELFDPAKSAMGIDLHGFAEAQASGTLLRGRRRPVVGPAPYWEGLGGFELRIRTPSDVMEHFEHVLIFGWQRHNVTYIEAAPIEGTRADTLSFGVGLESLQLGSHAWLEWVRVDWTRVTGELRQDAWSSPVWAPIEAQGFVPRDPRIEMADVRLVGIHFERAMLPTGSPYQDTEGLERYRSWLNSGDALLMRFDAHFGWASLWDRRRDHYDQSPRIALGMSFVVPTAGQLALSTNFGVPSYTPDGQNLLLRWQNELDARWSPQDAFWGVATTLRYDSLSVSPFDANNDGSIELESNTFAAHSEAYLKLWGLEFGAYHTVRTFPGALSPLPPGRQGLYFHEAGLQLRLR